MMKPRALILDVFGDYLRYVGSEVRAADLVSLLGVLGVEAATVRMTLSRLKGEGWFTTTRAGRETLYRLSDDILELLDEGRRRIFAPYQESWDGWWTQVVFQMPESDRAVREQLKKRLAWLGFGPLSASTWITPRSIRDDAFALVPEFPIATIDVLRSRTDDADVDRDLARRCWDLDALNADYSEFISGHLDLASRAGSMTGKAALAARTELVSTYRHFPFRDPSLPLALQPDGWRGAEAHAMFLEIHDALAIAATEYVSTVIREDIRVPLLADKNI
jgi:phenylacetic acid degradation operon negative regulatory protein